jgi:glycosyltransferase involved in cell wall biosynthesis
MKILLINKFLFAKGGDAISTITTGKLLAAKGHHVSYWGMKDPSNPAYAHDDLFIDNVDFDNPKSTRENIRISLNLLYSREAHKKFERLLKIERPDIVHLNNFAHQISPSILSAFREFNISSVMTMHDYKNVCASYSMLAKGKICEACRGGRYYQCFAKSCVKNSRVKSLLNTIEMYFHHKILHIYDRIDIFISPSMFLKNEVEKMGFGGKIVYLANFVNLEEYRPQYEWTEKSIVYFGRLSSEKGLFTLIEALKGLDVKLKIIGDGPLKDAIGDRVKGEGVKNIELLGYKSGEELKDEIEKSMFMVLPSECYENNPRTIIEGFALGKPVVGARIGGIPELVKDGETGITFESGNAQDLADKIRTLIKQPDLIVEMGKKARRFVESKLNPEQHYSRLMAIYQEAMGERKGVVYK